MIESPIKEWSKARFKNWIISLLRRGTMRWPPRNQCLANAKTKKKRNKKTNRLAQHYRCNGCKKDFPMKEVCVDHIQPVVSTSDGFTDFDRYIERMYCSIEGLQVLCNNGEDSCHAKKTKKERECRKGGKISQK